LVVGHQAACAVNGLLIKTTTIVIKEEVMYKNNTECKDTGNDIVSSVKTLNTLKWIGLVVVILITIVETGFL
jgi:hypothetical protein